MSGDAIGTAQQRSFEPQRPATRARAAQDSQLERGVDLEVLHMQPGSGAARPRRDEGRQERQQRRLHRDHDLWAPTRLPQQHRQARERVAEGVERARRATGPPGNPGWAAPHVHTLQGRARIARSGVAVADAPGRVVRRGRHDPHLMPALRQPLHHLGVVLADRDQLRRVVGRVQQDAHAPAARRQAATRCRSARIQFTVRSTPSSTLNGNAPHTSRSAVAL